LSVRASIFTQLLVVNVKQPTVKFTTLFSEKLTRSLFQQLNISEFELPFRVVTSSLKIETNLFPRCSIKASAACKITQAKSKDDGVMRKFEYISNRELKFQVPFNLFHVNFAILQ